MATRHCGPCQVETDEAVCFVCGAGTAKGRCRARMVETELLNRQAILDARAGYS